MVSRPSMFFFNIPHSKKKEIMYMWTNVSSNKGDHRMKFNTKGKIKKPKQHFLGQVFHTYSLNK